ncbi:MAG: hypothetical protein HRT61_11600 [Ekhidna sp.]|nr:hypothetical protein [Ekhidna sp.]
MRLGQFARKYDIRVQDLISYLESDTKEKMHFNTKLSEETEADVLDFFGLEPLPDPVLEESHELSKAESESVIESDLEPKSEEIVDTLSDSSTEEEITWDAEDSGFYQKESNKELPATPLDDIASVEGEIANPQEVLSSPGEEPNSVVEPDDNQEEKSEPHSEDEVIQTDKLLELLDSEEPSTDLDKIKLIKAPKRELSGLKVLGKVDLPEPKKKADAEEEPGKTNSTRRKKNNRPELSDEEKERRRLKAKRKKEAFEARQEKRRKEQKAKKDKERRAAHYQQRLEHQKTASKTNKQRTKQREEAKNLPKEVKESKPVPKTMLGRLWRWLNT